MYTKTTISRDAITAITDNRELGFQMLHDLIDFGILIADHDEFLSLLSELPLDISKTFEKWVTDNTIARRTRTNSLYSEIEIANSTDELHIPTPHTSIINYRNVAPVKARNSLRRGEHRCANRDEFFTQALKPIIESLRRPHLRVDVVDQYLFQDIERMMQRANSRTKITDYGLIWFLQAVSQSIDPGEVAQVNLYTSESANNSGMYRDDIIDICTKLFESTSFPNLNITIEIVPLTNNHNKNVKFEIRERRFVFNSLRKIALDKGLDDLAIYKRGDRYTDAVNSLEVSFWPMAGRNDHAEIKMFESSIPDDYRLRIN